MLARGASGSSIQEGEAEDGLRGTLVDASVSVAMYRGSTGSKGVLPGSALWLCLFPAVSDPLTWSLPALYRLARLFVSLCESTPLSPTVGVARGWETRLSRDRAYSCLLDLPRRLLRNHGGDPSEHEFIVVVLLSHRRLCGGVR